MDGASLDEQGRPEPPFAAGEAATLLGFLDFQRATLAWKCGGLGEEELARTVPPSEVSLAGLLQHLASVEDFWFTEVVGHQPTPEPWDRAEGRHTRDWGWRGAARRSGPELRALWEERVERSRAVLAPLLAEGEAQALAATHPAWGGREQVSLRWVLVHMVEEYARHNGHADLLREAIDGQTGE